MRITITAGNRTLIREGSDANKMALMTVGNPFGLALYNNHQCWIEGFLAEAPDMDRMAP